MGSSPRDLTLKVILLTGSSERDSSGTSIHWKFQTTAAMCH